MNDWPYLHVYQLYETVLTDLSGRSVGICNGDFTFYSIDTIYRTLTNGVPQGTAIGHTLFLKYKYIMQAY